MRRPQRLLLITLATIIVAAVIIATRYWTPEAIFALTGPVALSLFFLIIILEVVIAPVPGGVIGLLGAATFGFWTAWPIMYVANVLGALIVFHFARLLGQPFVDKNLSEHAQQRYNHWLEKHPRLIIIAYAIPIFPIDTISILLGLTEMKRRRFFITILIGLPVYTGITAFLGSTIGPHIPYLEPIGIGVFIILVAMIAYIILRR